jgi:hypothetical protein
LATRPGCWSLFLEEVFMGSLIHKMGICALAVAALSFVACQNMDSDGGWGSNGNRSGMNDSGTNRGASGTYSGSGGTYSGSGSMNGTGSGSMSGSGTGSMSGSGSGSMGGSGSTGSGR